MTAETRHLFLCALLLLVAYELLRWLIVGAVRRATERRVSRYLLEKRVRLDRYKLADRRYVRAEVMDDPAIGAAVAEAAQRLGSVERARREVDEYLREMVPAFSFVTYYQLGRRLARAATNLVYDVATDRASLVRAAERAGPGDVVVYVANHRSNADYVLLARVLMRQTAISYAVGEWARVWPLDALFRRFGAFFVRRGHRDALYHAVLRRYVQLSARRGVTQGIFPEGALSRDGKLRPAKVGLLASLALLLADPDYRGDVLIVPVGLNFDRVLEDAALVAEREDAPPPGARERLFSLLRLLVRGPIVIVENLLRLLLGRLRRHGVAAVAFGEPISLRALLREDGREAADEAWAKALGPRVMQAIGRVVPVTPVTVTCLALAAESGPTTRDHIKARVRGLCDRLHEAGAPFARVPRLRALRSIAARLDRSRDDRRPEMREVEDDLAGWDEAEALIDVALPMLARRGMVRVEDEMIAVPDARRDLVAYYANSLGHFVSVAGAQAARLAAAP